MLRYDSEALVGNTWYGRIRSSAQIICSGSVLVSGRNVPEIQRKSCGEGSVCHWKLWL